MIILKIAGFTLAGLVGLLLLVSALVLFVPIRYELKLNKDETLETYFRLTWLLGFFRVCYRDKAWSVMAFWFKRLGENKKQKTGNRKQKTKANNQFKEGSKQNKSETPKKQEKSQRNPLQMIKSIINYPDKGLIMHHGKKLIFRTVRAFKPRKFRLRGTVGLDDPADTGYLLGVLGIVTGITGLDAVITGDFEERQLSGELYIKDAITLWSLTWPLVIFCLKKPIRRLIIKYLIKER